LTTRSTVKKKTVILNMTWYLYSRITLYMTPTVTVITVRLRVFSKKCQYNKTEFSQKYQYKKNEVSV
jgi:hypothetical protein